MQRETRQRRNAHARSRRLTRKEAERWCAAHGAQVEPWPCGGVVLVRVRLPGFYEVVAPRLEQGVALLRPSVDAWCAGPAQEGPTGASLARYRALRSIPGGGDAQETGQNARAVGALPAR